MLQYLIRSVADEPLHIPVDAAIIMISRRCSLLDPVWSLEVVALNIRVDPAWVLIKASRRRRLACSCRSGLSTY